MKETVLKILLVIVVIGCVYGLMKFGKWASFNWFYKDMVRQTVEEMVQPSALKR